MNTVNLSGLCVLNTRPLGQADALSTAIRQAGGEAIEFPTMAINPMPTTWLEQMPNLQQVSHAIFTSANAVEYAFRAFQEKQLTWPETIHVMAIGEATKQALLQHQISHIEVPVKFDSEHFITLPSLQAIQNQIILLFKGEGGRQVILETLRSRGAKVIALDVYCRALPKLDQDKSTQSWQDAQVDIILITSQQSMHNLFFLLGKQAEPWLQNLPCLVISKRLVDEAKQLGIKTVLCCEPNNIMETLEQFKQGLTHE